MAAYFDGMSYPDPRYLAKDGEVSAIYRPIHQKPDLTIGTHTVMHYLATGASTRGDFGLYRVDMAPQTRGAATHFHRTMSESFFILSGTMRLFDGARWVDAKAGEFLYVPEGGLHGFGNESDDPASLLMLFTPGPPREAYFEALAERATGRSFTEDEWKAFCERHDSYFV
ncbi:cupin domain-containing protein [Pendulispora albinea]|uniref:Cupin domain-containing protein n=1 Tax=Pendulispora albinea TaxID=2741071 RepID=A0ABZ2LM79_9BACT